MRAWVLDRQAPASQSPLRLVQLPDPEPGPGEVGLRVLACGVCHTDLHIVQGDLPLMRSPLIPGHQIVGRIEKVGAGVDASRVGSRVGITWLSSACGRCQWCLSSRENLCEQARFTGYHVDGGFAEIAVAPAAAAYPLPGSFDDVQAAPLLCAGVIGYRSYRLCQVEPGQRLGLFGFGASAHLTLQIARHYGCEVYVFSRGQAHRKLALDLGAAWAGQTGEQPPAKLHAAITFAPVGSVVAEALAVLERGGTVAINAIHLDSIPELDYGRHLYWERTLRSVTNLTSTDAQEFLELAGRLRPRTIVRAFPLHQANQVLALMADSKLRAAAALVPEIN